MESDGPNDKIIFTFRGYDIGMEQDYKFEEQSRRPITVFSFMVSCIMLGVGINHGAPWYFLAPIFLSGLMLMWMLVVNRRSGMHLTGSELRLYSGAWAQHVHVAAIKAVSITCWSEGAPTVSLFLDQGMDIAVPGHCVGSVTNFVSALESRGVPIQRR